MAKKQGLTVTAFDARQMVRKGKLDSELEMERAVRAERLLRLMSEDQPHFEALRNQVRDLVISYEAEHWSNVNVVTEDQMRESDMAEKQAEKERMFFKKRKGSILKSLKQNGLNQNDLAAILAHSKSYTSELLNGVRAFSLNDLINIHRLLNIDLEDLIFTKVSAEVAMRFNDAVEKSSEKKANSANKIASVAKLTTKVST